MVVALDLERDRLAVAEVDDAGVLARPLQDTRPGARQALEETRRVLVATVLRPEEREHRQLEVVRVAVEEAPDTLQLPIGQPEGPVERLFRDCRQRDECNRAGRRLERAAYAVEPAVGRSSQSGRGSHADIGCGHAGIPPHHVSDHRPGAEPRVL
jgi:hypothetical protein